MAHPDGDSGSRFHPVHTFDEVYNFVGEIGITFKSTTGEQISAVRSIARDKTTPTIVFYGERNRHGSVCRACWGYRIDCNQSRIGQCVEALDSVIR